MNEKVIDKEWENKIEVRRQRPTATPEEITRGFMQSANNNGQANKKMKKKQFDFQAKKILNMKMATNNHLKSENIANGTKMLNESN